MPGIEWQVDDVNDIPLSDVQRTFPHYRIWQEVTGVRQARYVAQARELSVRPHTVVTADLAELQAELAPLSAPVAATSTSDTGRHG